MSNDGRPKGKQSADYTGLKIAAILAPLFLLFIFLGKPEMGLTVDIVLGMTIFAVKLRWNLRNHGWFWATIAVVLALHVPLFFIVHWPDNNVPTLAYAMPFGIADFLIISAAIRLAEKVFLAPTK